MKKTIISFFELEKWEEDYFCDNFSKYKNLEINYYREPINKKNITKIKNSDILSVFIYSQINKEIISQLPNLKYITTMSTGYDHIDLSECKKRKIKVSNVPYYGENTVAEHTLALILALSRKLPESYERAKRGDFTLKGLRGFDLKGKTIGLVGLGHIGEHVAKMAKNFGMKIIAYDPFKDYKLAKKLGFRYVTLKNLLANSDIVSLHAPYNTKTHHLINKKNIKKVKKGAYLINTARGGLIDTDALMWALNKKIIAGAGLDVLEEEYFIKEEKELLAKPFQEKCDLKKVIQSHLLIQDPRVIVTPHNAFNSQEALERILDTTIDNIISFTKGKKKNLIKQS